MKIYDVLNDPHFGWPTVYFVSLAKKCLWCLGRPNICGSMKNTHLMHTHILGLAIDPLSSLPHVSPPPLSLNWIHRNSESVCFQALFDWMQSEYNVKYTAYEIYIKMNSFSHLDVWCLCFLWFFPTTPIPIMFPSLMACAVVASRLSKEPMVLLVDVGRCAQARVRVHARLEIMKWNWKTLFRIKWNEPKHKESRTRLFRQCCCCCLSNGYGANWWPKRLKH